MTSTQKAAKRARRMKRRTAHAAQSSGRPAQSFHTTDPMRFGSRLDARGTTEKAIRDLLGYPDTQEIPEALRLQFTRLIRATGSPSAAKEALEKTMKQEIAVVKEPKRRKVVDLPPDASATEDDLQAAGLVKPFDTSSDHPSEEEWAKILATAKAKKKSAAKAAQAAGYELLGGCEKRQRDRTSWVVKV